METQCVLILFTLCTSLAIPPLTRIYVSAALRWHIRTDPSKFILTKCRAAHQRRCKYRGYIGCRSRAPTKGAVNIGVIVFVSGGQSTEGAVNIGVVVGVSGGSPLKVL